jgi:hypothetical protein
MGIDCPNIYKHTGIPEGTFIEGCAIIESRAEQLIRADGLMAFLSCRFPAAVGKCCSRAAAQSGRWAAPNQLTSPKGD